MIAIITQGGVKEGLGHIMRMLWLVNELGEDAVFIMNRKNEVAFRLVESVGFKTTADFKALSSIKPDTIFFDKFNVNTEEVIKAKSYGKVVLFDSTTANELADVVINALVRCNCDRCYHGLRYLILRKEFHSYWKKKKVIKDDIKKVMLMFGGSDPSNYTTKVARILENYKITAVVGPCYPYMDELKTIADKIKVIVNPENVAELMFRSDAVVSSLGLTMFEAMCVGTPVVAICQNSIQRWLLKEMPFLRFVQPEFDEKAFKEIFKKIKSKTIREELSKYGKELCDGLGIHRVLNLLKVVI